MKNLSKCHLLLIKITEHETICSLNQTKQTLTAGKGRVKIDIVHSPYLLEI